MARYPQDTRGTSWAPVVSSLFLYQVAHLIANQVGWHPSSDGANKEGGPSMESAGSGSLAAGKRAVSMPTIAGNDSVPLGPMPASPAAAQQQHVQQLLQALPAQYAMATSLSDRMHHARLLRELQTDPAASHTVRLAWAVEDATKAQLWLVFPDRRGSLSVISSAMSELNVNILKASVFNTNDGIAVDSFSVDRSGPHSA